MPEDSDDRRKKYLSSAEEARSKASNIKAKAQGIVEGMQYMEDLAEKSKAYAASIEDDTAIKDEYWTSGTNAWHSASLAMDKLGQDLEKHADVMYSTVGMTGSAINGMLSPAAYKSETVYKSVTIGNEYYINLNRTVEKIQWSEQVKNDLVRLGLSHPRGDSLSPYWMIDQAITAFQRPVGTATSPVGTLVQVRSGIDEVLADLLPRRPTQEKTPKARDKVRSILKQTAKDGIDRTMIEHMAEGIAPILRELSSAKDKNYGRDEILIIMNRAMTYLSSLLNAIDSSKLK